MGRARRVSHRSDEANKFQVLASRIQCLSSLQRHYEAAARGVDCSDLYHDLPLVGLRVDGNNKASASKSAAKTRGVDSALRILRPLEVLRGCNKRSGLL